MKPYTQHRSSLSPWMTALAFALFLALIQFLFAHELGMGIFRAKRTLFTVLGTSLLLAAPLPLLAPRMARFHAVACALILAVFAWGDTLYARQFHAAPSLRLWAQKGNLSGLGPSILGLARPSDLVFAALAMGAIAVVFLAWRKPFPRGRIQAGRRSALGLALAGLLLHTTIHVKNAFAYQRNPFLLSFDSQENAAVFTIPLYHALDALEVARSHDDVELTPEDKERIRRWFRGRATSSPVPTPSAAPEVPFGTAKGKNLLLIQWEALESSVVNLKVGETEVAPNLNRFLRESHHFVRHHAVVGHGNTSDAELASLSSFYPLATGSAFFRLPGNKYQGLPRILRNHGYQAPGFHGNAASFWNRGMAWPALGIDPFFDKVLMTSKGTARIAGMGIDDHDTFRFVLDTLAKTPSPWFAFVVTLSSHTPFQLPPELASEPRGITGMAGDYLRAIHYADHAFGEFMHTLGERGILSDTVVALYGDHEAVVADVRADAARQGLASFAINQGRVPFAIRLPHAKSGITDEAWSSQIDIAPTLAHVMGIDVEDELFFAMGRDLFTHPEGGAMHPFGHWFGGTGEAEAREALWVSDRLLRSCRWQAFCGKVVRE